MRLELSPFTGSENMHFQVIWVYTHDIFIWLTQLQNYCMFDTQSCTHFNQVALHQLSTFNIS
ncbi:hypothetical protein [uncultured Shewanella sp.]|uniref:hypothetical protein n=1 Tax=uncultured Shewanella sp. TaxID=173975 RepID=UPI00262478F3|nr:hypothetical protein [uncultured Shewanella sp.]